MSFGYLPPTLTSREAAVFLRVPISDVDAAITDGTLPLVNVGSHAHVDTRRLLALMGAAYERRG
jgi:hypothetical protein